MSAALGLLLGDRRRAVLLAVLLLGRGVRRADDGHVDAGREDGEDRRDDELDEEEVEEENVEATEFTHEGVTYLKDPTSGVLYDHEKFTTTGEGVAVGTWNEDTQSIDAAPEDDSEDEDEDDDEDESEE